MARFHPHSAVQPDRSAGARRPWAPPVLSELPPLAQLTLATGMVSPTFSFLGALKSAVQRDQHDDL